MKLLHAFIFSFGNLFLQTVTAAQPNFYSECDERDQLNIHISYDNEYTANLLHFNSGNCSGSGATSEHHDYFYDSENREAVLSLDILGCGLGELLHDSPYSTRNLYIAAANISLGVLDDINNKELVFLDAVLGAECGYRDVYTIKFEYPTSIEGHDEDACQDQLGPNGECLIPAFTSYNFTFGEFTDDTFTVPVDESTREKRAGNNIYLKLQGNGVPDGKTFGVKICEIVDDDVRYSVFDPVSGKCENPYVNFQFNYGETDDGQTFVEIIHRLFLLSQGDQDSYSLECQLGVCDLDDDDSDCKEWINACG